MAVITIDGIKLDVPENKNVLDCALAPVVCVW